uniref:Uncharacterized protein n=1 Tax=Romanomermis culicivorax TaxID=13658 RepID=A0A915K7U4_ROMCU
MYRNKLECIFKDKTLTPKEQHKMYSQLFSQYLTFEHENAQPATVILKQEVIDDNENENDGANLKEKGKKWLNDEMLIIGILKQFKCSASLLLEYVRGHLCFMQPIGSKQIEEEDVFETNNESVNDANTCLTTQEKVLQKTEQGYVFEHEPNLCLVHTVCDQCHQSEGDFCCNMCGQHKSWV